MTCCQCLFTQITCQQRGYASSLNSPAWPFPHRTHVPKSGLFFFMHYVLCPSIRDTNAAIEALVEVLWMVVVTEGGVGVEIRVYRHQNMPYSVSSPCFLEACNLWIIATNFFAINLMLGTSHSLACVPKAQAGPLGLRHFPTSLSDESDKIKS